MPSENAADAGFQTAFFMCRFSDGLFGSAGLHFARGTTSIAGNIAICFAAQALCRAGKFGKAV